MRGDWQKERYQMDRHEKNINNVHKNFLEGDESELLLLNCFIFNYDFRHCQA